MLIVTRKANESITIEPIGDLDPGMTLGEAFRNGPIEIKLVRINRTRVRLAIAAPPEFHVCRGTQDAMPAATCSSCCEPADGPVAYGLASEF